MSVSPWLQTFCCRHRGPHRVAGLRSMYMSDFGVWDPKDWYPGIPTTIQTMGVNKTTIAYPRVLIIGIGSTIILMVVEAQGIGSKLLLSYAAWPGQLKSAWTPGYLDTGFLGQFFSTPQHPPDMSLFGSTLAGGFCWPPEFGNRLMCFTRFMDIHGRTSNKRRIRKVEFTLAEVVSKDPKGYFESWT